jgi:alpha-1,6-mannosyltransferase
MQKIQKISPDSITKGLLILLGLASVLSYLYAWSLQDLRQNTVQFLAAFFAAFLLYAAATLLVLKHAQTTDRWALGIVFTGAILFCGLLIFTPPTLSDDMYRYVWDGRVQAEGISPYRYPPNAPELARLRDAQIWLFINRKSVVTVYPPGAEAVFAFLWRVIPDSVRWFQLVMSGAAILAGFLLVGLLHELGRSPLRALIFLWSPLLIFEVSHSAHIDALILPLLVGAWWGRVREKDGLVGALIGLATAIKFYPALLLPALWRPRHPRGRWTMPLAFISVLIALYLPYLWLDGRGVLGFLPDYLNEVFNISPLVKWLIYHLPHDRLAQSQAYVRMLSLGLWGLASLLMILFPPRDGVSALRRCLWPISIITLLNQNLFSWYILWLLPLLAVFLQEGVLHWGNHKVRLGLRLDAWTAWWLFSGLAALSYTFFINWKPVKAAIQFQFWPLYILLVLSLVASVLHKAQISLLNRPGLVRSNSVSESLER